MLDALEQVVPDQVAGLGLQGEAGPEPRRLDVGAVSGLLHPGPCRVVRPTPAVLVIEGVAERIEGLPPPGGCDVQATKADFRQLLSQKEGKPTNLGLDSYPVVTLREAREKALENRRSIHWGHDPRAARVPTFEAAVEKVMAIHSPTWKNPSRIAGQWRQTLRDYAYPRIGRKRVSEVATADVLAILQPIWSSKPAAARVVRQRIGAVMKWAVAKGYRSDNPAGDAIAAALPRNGNATRHHQALPHGEVSAALVKVRNSGSHAGVRLALEFMVLTATRSNEVRGATWDEFDHDVWTIPASRMKAKREHRVPLSRRALEIFEEARKRHDDGEIVFRGAKGGGINASMFSGLLRHLGIEGTPHGMRSSFRDWCSETGVAREVAEAALAHVVKNKVEAAYARSDLLDRRREVMQAWAGYLASERRDPEAGPIR